MTHCTEAVSTFQPYFRQHITQTQFLQLTHSKRLFLPDLRPESRLFTWPAAWVSWQNFPSSLGYLNLCKQQDRLNESLQFNPSCEILYFYANCYE